MAARWITSLFLVSLSLWAGATVFYSGAVLPLLFTNLAPHDAGNIAALIFPVYFRAGLALGTLATAASWMLARACGRRWYAVFALLALMTACEGWEALVILPQIAEVRGVDAEAARFQQLHTLSVRLNAVVLGGGLLVLASGALLFAPRRDDA